MHYGAYLSEVATAHHTTTDAVLHTTSGRSPQLQVHTDSAWQNTVVESCRLDTCINNPYSPPQRTPCDRLRSPMIETRDYRSTKNFDCRRCRSRPTCVISAERRRRSKQQAIIIKSRCARSSSADFLAKRLRNCRRPSEYKTSAYLTCQNVSNFQDKPAHTFSIRIFRSLSGRLTHEGS